MCKFAFVVCIGILLISTNGENHCFGQLATAKLKDATVAYGEIASDNSMINRGSFNDQSKEYRIENENGAFYLLFDGKQKGWVFKSSVELVDSPESSEPLKHQSKSNRDENESTQSTQVDPRKLVRILKSNGFRPSVDWKKSKFENGWVAVLHKAVGENEVSIEITGPNYRTISKMTLEAEVYQTAGLRNVTAEASKTLGLLHAPQKINSAMTNANSQSSLTTANGWTLKVKKHNRGGGFDVQVKRVINADTKSKVETKKTNAKTSATKLVSKFRTKLNANGLNKRIITGLKCKGKVVTITVVDVWSEMDYNSRLEAATTLYKLWALVASPDAPDSARISIQTGGETEIGGSRMWAGSLIWVQD